MLSSLLRNPKRTAKCGSNVFNRAGKIVVPSTEGLIVLLSRLFSYNRLLSVKEELEQKYLHLSQVYESEAKAKYQYLQQVEELSTEIRELRREVRKSSVSEREKHILSRNVLLVITLPTATSPPSFEKYCGRRYGRDTQDQESAKPLPRLVVSATMETYRGRIHSVLDFSTRSTLSLLNRVRRHLHENAAYRSQRTGSRTCRRAEQEQSSMILGRAWHIDRKSGYAQWLRCSHEELVAHGNTRTENRSHIPFSTMSFIANQLRCIILVLHMRN